MALPQNKISKQRKRNRKGANRYRGMQTCPCPRCGTARLSHRACKKCGHYDGKQVLTVVAE